jgi:hypothetical protein
MTEFVCNVCLYVRTRPGLSEDAIAETELLTVIGGQMVCVRHAPFVTGNHNAMLTSAVRFESNGEFDSLSAYQDWRHKQGRAAEMGA